MNCDSILLFDNGKIIEKNKYQEILKKYDFDLLQEKKIVKMLLRVKEKILNLFAKYFFKKLYYRKLCLIGHSHLLNFNKITKTLKRLMN